MEDSSTDPSGILNRNLIFLLCSMKEKRLKQNFLKSNWLKNIINQFPLLVITDFPQCKKIRRDEKYISDVTEMYSV